MKRAFRRAAFASAALGVVMTAPAYAQDQNADASFENSAIVVTARRVEENLQDVPISITVYDQEAITERNIVNSADLATYTPSLSVNERYGPEKASFAIRGFVQDFGTAPSVGTYFADVVGPRGASTTTAGDGVGVGQLFDLQNVQVLKGPQGTLFGRNTTGGAVLIVPNKPTGDLEGYVEASLGNYDMRRLQAVINVPLADTFKVRLGIDRMKRDGYLRNVNPLGVGPDRMANSDFIAARLSIVAELTPTLENYTIASYSDSDNDGTTFKLLGCETDPTKFSGIRFLGGTFGCGQIARQEARGDGWWDVENSHPNPRVHFEQWQFINTTTWEASDNLTIKNIVSYAEHREETNLNLGGDNFLNPDGTFFAPAIEINTTEGFNYGAQSTFTEELQFQGNHGRLTWQAGGFMERSNPIGSGSQSVPLLLNCSDPPFQCERGFGFDIPGFGFIPVANLGRPIYRIKYRSYGLYAQGTYEITPSLRLTGGIRYTWDSESHYQSSVGIQYLEDNVPTAFCTLTTRIFGPGGPGDTVFLDNPNEFDKCGQTFSDSWEAPTWVIDLSYDVTPDVMVYAKWSRGYRAGGVNTPFVFFETWDEEKVEAYEIGAKTQFRGGAVSGYFNIAGFYNDFSDQQIQATLTGKTGAPSTGGTAIVNAGKSRIYGLEVDTALTLFDSLNISGGYTYLNTKLQELVGIPEPDDTVWVPGTSPWAFVVPTAEAGGPLSLSPKHRVQVSATYTLPLPSSVGELSFGGTFVHTSSQIANTASPFGTIPSTDLLNLNASWKDVAGQPFDLSFFMTNVTNEKYVVNVSNFWNSFGFDSAPVGPPRMWGFRLKYKFGQ